MSGNQDELYRFSTTGYSEKAIYGRSTDSRGHQTTKRLNVSPALANSININFQRWGYPTADAFYRDAAVHRLHYWLNNEPDEQRVQFFLTQVWLDELQAEIEDAERTVKSFETQLHNCDNEARLKMLLDSAHGYAFGLPEHLSDIADKLRLIIARYTK